MVLSTPTLIAELITIDDDIVRYRVFCDPCEDWHYHVPQGGLTEPPMSHFRGRDTADKS